MFLATVFSTFFLLTSPISVHQSIEVIRQYHLETTEGRTAFLIDKLTPYTTAANQLNQEIGVLSKAIQILSPQDDQQTILALTEIVSQKMSQLTTMMFVLNSALSLNEDFLQIDSILHQTIPLKPIQQEIVDRIAALCSAVDSSTEQPEKSD